MTKIVFNRKEFTRAIDYCMTSIEKKSALPILSSILVEVKDGICKFISTNLETSVITKITALEFENEITLAIPANYVSNLCRVIKGELIYFDYDAEHMLLNITAEKSKYNVPCADYNDFPSVIYEENEGSPVDVKKIANFFKKMSFSMTEVNVNKAYSGVLIIKPADNEMNLEMVTTDIHRISVLTLKNTQLNVNDINSGIVIVGKNFSEIQKIFTDEVNVTAFVNEGKVTIKSENVIFISRLIKNEFPNYRSVTGTVESIEQKSFALINRKELIDAIKRVIVLNTDEKIWATKFEFRGNTLSLTANAEFGGNSSDEILIEKGFESDRTIGINAKYLLDVLSVLDCSEVRIIAEEGLRPLSVVESAEDFYYIHMIMPLRI